jgi:lipopolysaccharide biosynthesis protein
VTSKKCSRQSLQSGFCWAEFIEEWAGGSGWFGAADTFIIVAALNQDIEKSLLSQTVNSIMKSEAIRAIAFHLPQFHPIPENDKWWGKGFTDWTNVAKAKPLFKGHYQPHVPADLGYYDMREPEARAAQAALAREYGVHGFCYYHYWFNGRRLLEQPVNEIVASGKPDFPFCLCWANENWTRRWDGQEQEVLMAQNYGDEDDLNHIRWLADVFRDPRYIRVQGRPLFLVYRLSRLPNPARTVELWRKEARQLGVGEIFLCNVESFPTDHGMAPRHQLDGAVEFAPDYGVMPVRQEPNWLTHKLARRPRTQRLAGQLGLAQPWLSHHGIFSYPDLMTNMIGKPPVSYVRFPCVTPSWDNHARRKMGASIYVGSSPALYRKWLGAAVQKAKAAHPEDPIVFINAWNEWAEGNHLEPCRKWGRSYLEATREALNA